MIESDADRLALIRALGGQLVCFDGGQFWAVFDNPSRDSSLSDLDIEGASPSLTALTSDVESLRKDTALTFTDYAGRSVSFLIEKHEPDGSGMSRLSLKY